MAELIWRLRGAVAPSPGTRGGGLGWLGLAGVVGALVVGWSLTLSVQATCAFVLIVVVVGLYQHDRQWGIAAMFVLWFAAPGLRRLFGLTTGYVSNDPLSLAPFLATGAVAALELLRSQVAATPRRILLVAGVGFAIGLPVGLIAGPQAAIYAFVAYLAALAGALFGFNENGSLESSTLRRVLLFGLPPIALYACTQRFFGLNPVDQAWLDATRFSSIGGTSVTDEVRVFGTLNSPGTLAPLLALSLLCYLTVARRRLLTVAGAALIAVALSVTLVRSAWVALIVAGLAHVIASEGRSARLVLGSAAAAVALSLALSPVSNTARDVVNRFNTVGDLSADQSATERSATFSQTFPEAAASPLGHGLGTAGEATILTEDSADLRAADNGYLSLIYQVGPIGFVLVLAALALVLRAAWEGARARAPGQDLRLLLFAMFVYLLFLLSASDVFYGIHGVIFWFIAGQVLAYRYGRRRPGEPGGSSIASA